MATLAQKITVDLKLKKLFINGAEFPWLISKDGVEVNGLASANALATVALTLLATDVEVIPEDSDGS